MRRPTAPTVTAKSRAPLYLLALGAAGLAIVASVLIVRRYYRPRRLAAGPVRDPLSVWEAEGGMPAPAPIHANQGA